MDSWAVLQSVLLGHARAHDVESVERSPFGVRYTILGALHAQGGRAAMVRTVWFIDEGGAAPRFVTAYPVERTRA